MPLVVKDRVKETTTTTGTGTITLLGAVSGYQAFSVIGNTNTTYYAIVDSAAGTWEVGIGTYSTTGPTLTRDTILESSSGGTAISFAAGTKDVFCTYPAERSMYVDGTTITPATAATLPVVSGGTGSTSLTANNVLLGNGTSAPLTVAPSTSGNVLTSNGTTWVSSAAPAGAAATPTALGTVYGRTQSATPFAVSLGFEAGNVNTDAQSTFVGYRSGRNSTTGIAMTAIGFEALQDNTTGGINTAIGQGSLKRNTTGFRNTAIGATTLQFVTTGFSNTATGQNALGLNTGNLNTSTGTFSLQANTTGSNNTALGYQAGASGTNDLTTGTNNILIGYQATATAATVSNETTIGNSSTTSARMFGDLKFLNSYTEAVFAVTGTTPALSPANGTIQTWTLSGNSTPTAGTWADGQSITLMIDDGSAFTINWGTVAVTWKTDAGSAPTLNTTGFTAITLWKVGAVIYGARVGDA